MTLAPPRRTSTLAALAESSIIMMRCPRCNADFTAEVPLALLAPQKDGRRWLYCSDSCRSQDHPWMQQMRRPITAPRLVPSPEDAAANALRQRALRWEQSACADGTGYPIRYRRFALSELKPAAQEIAPEVLAWTPTKPGRGLGLMGLSEAGKSYLAAELARRLWMAGHDVAMCSMPGLIVALKGGVSMEVRTALVARLKAAEIVFFDDLGMEGHTETSLSSLYDILQHREEWERPNIYTCNLGGSGLKEKFANAVPLYNRIKRTAGWRSV